MDLVEYFERKEREFAEASAHPERPPMFEAEAGSSGQAGRVLAFLGMTEKAYMKVTERVVIQDDGHPNRESYSYALILDEAFAYGWERDPFTHPELPVHEHGPEPDRKREA